MIHLHHPNAPITPGYCQKIQVYGLLSSGTNLLEWSINKHLPSLNYINLYKTNDVKELIPYYGKVIALKHSLPSLTHSDYCVVIYKTYSNWCSTRPKKWTSKEGHDRYIKLAQSLDKTKCLIFNYTEFCNDMNSHLNRISSMVNEPLINLPIVKPEGRMNNRGALAQPQFIHK